MHKKHIFYRTRIFSNYRCWVCLPSLKRIGGQQLGNKDILFNFGGEHVCNKKYETPETTT